MEKRYRYVKIGKSYFCVQQNPVALAWLLWTKNRSFRLGSLGINRRKAILAVKTLVRHQLHGRSSDRLLELPVYGNFCRPVHRGYRVFDLRRQTVVRTFDPGVDPAIVEREVEGVRKASPLECTPTVRRWNIEEQWYEEDFVLGSRAYVIAQSDTAAFLEMYHQDIEPCIESMILLHAPVKVIVGEYVDNAGRTLHNHRLLDQGVDASEVATIESFVESTVARLNRQRDRQVDLVFSHGDFSLRNILKTAEGIKVIDWESVSLRSMLFDLYNCFLTELYYGRANTDLVSEIDEAIVSLQSRLALRAPEVAKALPSLAQTYRWLFYFERIQMLLERDPGDSLLKTILRSIDVFNRHEEAVTSA